MSDAKPLRVIVGRPDKPLVIAGRKVQCYVVEGGIRVLSQGGFLAALGATECLEGCRQDGDRISRFPICEEPRTVHFRYD